MNDLNLIETKIHFKLLNTKMFGGEGTEGFCSVNLKEVPGPNGESYINKDAYRKEFSDILEVPIENIVEITQEEYISKTENKGK